MPKRSAGLLMFRRNGAALEVFLVHPGGPLWTRKDAGAWTIPKGEYDEREDALGAAQREFTEETGFQAAGEFLSLGEVCQTSGKIVKAWAVAGDCDAHDVRSNEFEMEWPPRSGRITSFPEVDRAGWFTVPEAEAKLLPAQRPFLERLQALLAERSDG